MPEGSDRTDCPQQSEQSGQDGCPHGGPAVTTPTTTPTTDVDVADNGEVRDDQGDPRPAGPTTPARSDSSDPAAPAVPDVDRDEERENGRPARNPNTVPAPDPCPGRSCDAPGQNTVTVPTPQGPDTDTCPGRSCDAPGRERAPRTPSHRRPSHLARRVEREARTAMANGPARATTETSSRDANRRPLAQRPHADENADVLAKVTPRGRFPFPLFRPVESLRVWGIRRRSGTSVAPASRRIRHGVSRCTRRSTGRSGR